LSYFETGYKHRGNPSQMNRESVNTKAAAGGSAHNGPKTLLIKRI